MIAAELKTTLDVKDKLTLLGLTPEVLKAVALAYYMAGLDCTENNPPTYAGIHRWGRANRVFRDYLIPMGWERLDYKNIPLTVHPEGRLAVVALNGDRFTGIANLHPRTKIPRGICTEMIVSNNAQLQLDMFSGMAGNDQEFEWETWILLMYQDGTAIRMELSLPIRIDDTGNIISWGDRIVLEPIEFGSEVFGSPDFAPDPEVTITRRSIK